MGGGCGGAKNPKSLGRSRGGPESRLLYRASNKAKKYPGPVCRVSLQKALNHDITRKIKTSEIECLSSDCFEYLETST